jgi:hypothetical protein
MMWLNATQDPHYRWLHRLTFFLTLLTYGTFQWALYAGSPGTFLTLIIYPIYSFLGRILDVILAINDRKVRGECRRNSPFFDLMDVFELRGTALVLYLDG